MLTALRYLSRCRNNNQALQLLEVSAGRADNFYKKPLAERKIIYIIAGNGV
jgi:hypothetical protein